MIDKYIDLVHKALEKLPFFNYINRFSEYIRNPELLDNDSINEQLEHSLLDVFNALGLVIVIASVFTLYSVNFDYMNAYKVFNPLFLAFSYIFYGICFSFSMAIASWLFSKLPLFRFDSCSKTLRYTVFCHSLRFYAAIGFLLGLPAVHATGLVITEGITFENAFSNWFLTIYIMVTLIWFPLRLFVSPLFRYLRPKKFQKLGYISILLVMYVATSINQILPLPFIGNILNKTELCSLFRSGSLYKNADLYEKPIMEKLFCEVT